MDSTSAIYVAGGDTLIGSALLRRLSALGYQNIVGTGADSPNLHQADAVDTFFAMERPEVVFLAAGKSGGIHANQSYPADLLRDNLVVEVNVIQSAHHHGTSSLLYLASSCCYPKHSDQPMQVESLLTGRPEPTNQSYSVAKLAGIELTRAYRLQYGSRFIAGIPADVFGPGDDFSPSNSHVIAGLIRRMHEAKVSGAPVFKIWGTGAPRREFMFADDLADACIFTVSNYEGTAPINLGGGADLSIGEAAAVIKEAVGYQGELRYNTSKPDGMPLKILDASVLAGLGWRGRTSFQDAVAITYKWFLKNLSQGEL